MGGLGLGVSVGAVETVFVSPFSFVMAIVSVSVFAVVAGAASIIVSSVEVVVGSLRRNRPGIPPPAGGEDVVLSIN